MANRKHQLPSIDEIKSQVLDELRYHKANAEDEDIEPYVEFERLVHVVGDLCDVDLSTAVRKAVRLRTKAVLRLLERSGLAVHWVAENWQLTDDGLRVR